MSYWGAWGSVKLLQHPPSAAVEAKLFGPNVSSATLGGRIARKNWGSGEESRKLSSYLLKSRIHGASAPRWIENAPDKENDPGADGRPAR